MIYCCTQCGAEEDRIEDGHCLRCTGSDFFQIAGEIVETEKAFDAPMEPGTTRILRIGSNSNDD